MNINKILLGLTASVLVITGCFVPGNLPETGIGAIPVIVDELSYNYAHLRYFYVYAQDELRPYSGYKGRGKNIPYGDVLAMYADLSDRWTNYWVPANAAGIWAQLTTSGEEQKLIGINLRVKVIEDPALPDELNVDRVWADSPAEESGLIQKDDRIIAVNGFDLTAPPVLKGDGLLEKYRDEAKGDTVSLTVRRGDTDISVPAITKKVMMPPTVYLDYVHTIPVIQITGFSENSGYDESAANKTSSTIKELRTALTRIKNENHSVGIIDLRGNPGGSVDQCFAAIDELVAAGSKYIRYEQHYNDGVQQVIKITDIESTPGGLGEAIRWIFLADANSASTAEILLYAVKNCRPETYFIGATTYGKGVGQIYLYPTPAGGLFGITAMKFFDKNGNTYHGTGIVPDAPAPDSAAALEAAVAYALASISPSLGRSVLDAAPPVDRTAIRALNNRLVERQVPSDGIRGGAWKVLHTDEVHLNKVHPTGDR